MSRLAKWMFTATTALVFFLGLLLLALYFWVTEKFETATLDIIFIYLSLPLTGVDVRYLTGFAFQVLSVLAVTGVYAVLFFRSYRRERFLGVATRVLRIFMAAAAAGLLVFSLGILDKRYEWREFFFPDTAFYTYFEDNVRQVGANEVSFPGGRRNLVLVILESGEEALVDGTVFDPVLMPRLDALRKRHAGFYGARQVVGTEFSIASFFSLLYGVPFLSTLSGLRLHEDDETAALPQRAAGESPLQNAAFIGVLQEHGYRIELFRCADARFSSYNILMPIAADKSVIYDYVYFKNHRNDYGGRENNWGVDDSYIYDRVKERLEEIAGDGPFAIIIQTVNTHAPGYYEKGMERPYGDFRDAFVQADIMVSGFVEWIEAQDFGKDTVVAVVGDHLLGVGSVGPVALPDTSARGIFTLFANPAAPGDSVRRERLFATWDLPATLLAAVGAHLPGDRFGLGTSLFSNEKTLLERDGVSKYNRLIKKRSKLYQESYAW